MDPLKDCKNECEKALPERREECLSPGHERPAEGGLLGGLWRDDRTLESMAGDRTDLARPRLLLHSCCGPCSTACLERLYDRFDVTVFFYNPNITDVSEYELRKKTQKKVVRCFNEDLSYDGKISFLEGPYDPERYLAWVAGHEEDREGGPRCGLCFELRLEKTAQTAKMQGFDAFTTTLTVSPHKDSPTILSIGRKLGLQYGVEFLEENFKKKDGFKRSIELSKKYGLYRQDYCGCGFSQWEGCHVGEDPGDQE